MARFPSVRLQHNERLSWLECHAATQPEKRPFVLGAVNFGGPMTALRDEAALSRDLFSDRCQPKAVVIV